MSGPDSTGHTRSGNRPVRSFVIRGGRLTQGQEKALDRLWPEFGIDTQSLAGQLNTEELLVQNYINYRGSNYEK